MTTSVEEVDGVLSGGCLCQATTYTVPKPPQDLPEGFNWEANYVVPGDNGGSNKWAASHCYCNSCRLSVGTLVATWFSIPREQFKLQKKGPTTMYRSSSDATREFVSPLSSPFLTPLIIRLISVPPAGRLCSFVPRKRRNSLTSH